MCRTAAEMHGEGVQLTCDSRLAAFPWTPHKHAARLAASAGGHER